MSAAQRGGYPDLDPPPLPVPDPPRGGEGDGRAAAAEELIPRVEPVLAAAGAGEGKEAKKEAKAEKLGRGVETMYRTSYQMHVDLSSIADAKANILISINGLIISVILAAVAPRIRTDLWLALPTAVVLGTCLVAISCAILAARPRVNRVQRSERRPEVGDNLMFFGGFLALTPEEYEAAVEQTIREPERLYRGMTRDLYALGLVLDRKFRLLRIAYTVFMVGLAVGVLLYLGVYIGIGMSEPAAVAPASLPMILPGG